MELDIWLGFSLDAFVTRNSYHGKCFRRDSSLGDIHKTPPQQKIIKKVFADLRDEVDFFAFQRYIHPSHIFF